MPDKAGQQVGRGKPFAKGDPRAGRPAGIPNKVTIEVREAARALVGRKEYLDGLQVRLDAGELAPAVENMLWHYAYGKPAETLNINHIKPEEIAKMPDAALRAILSGEEIAGSPVN